MCYIIKRLFNFPTLDGLLIHIKPKLSQAMRSFGVLIFVFLAFEVISADYNYQRPNQANSKSKNSFFFTDFPI